MSALVSYDSSSGDDSPNESDNKAIKCLNIITPSKRNLKEKIILNIKPKRQKLPVPEAVKSMFESTECTEQDPDEPSLHDGRIRTFAHERGNWASYVYISFPEPEKLKELAESINDLLQPVAVFYTVEDFHVSLSRTLVLRHHWIEALFESLKSKLKTCERCVCDITEIEFYCNDEQTRTFLGLKIGAGLDVLTKYVKEIDSALQEFKLPVYYEKPSFHMSIAWANGDVRDKLNDTLKDKLQTEMLEYFDTYPRLSILNVDHLCLKTGNKMYRLPLL